jgi:hypothetical protein
VTSTVADRGSRGCSIGDIGTCVRRGNVQA